MGGFSGDRFADVHFSVSLARGASADYRRFVAVLSARARRLGARDPEAAAQEALRRSLEHPKSQPAMEYYFSENPNAEMKIPDWPLDQLLAWLHGVVTNVVREEHSRASARREIPFGWERQDGTQNHAEPADPSAGQLDALIQAELEGIVEECLPMIDREYRVVLKMRADGCKYDEIARHMGVNENTVATWVSRGIRDLGKRVRKRIMRSSG